MGASMKDIKHRIKSVESTMQITKAMELVASSKLRRAKERAESARPFFNILYETITDLAAHDEESFYTRDRSGKPPLPATGDWPAATTPIFLSWWTRRLRTLPQGLLPSAKKASSTTTTGPGRWKGVIPAQQSS